MEREGKGKRRYIWVVFALGKEDEGSEQKGDKGRERKRRATACID